jgi:hypothetical protein
VKIVASWLLDDQEQDVCSKRRRTRRGMNRAPPWSLRAILQLDLAAVGVQGRQKRVPRGDRE